jgi:hypothetical protein
LELELEGGGGHFTPQFDRRSIGPVPTQHSCETNIILCTSSRTLLPYRVVRTRLLAQVPARNSRISPVPQHAIRRQIPVSYRYPTAMPESFEERARYVVVVGSLVIAEFQDRYL